MSSWREYEQHIVSVFQEKFPKLSVTPNDHVWGQFSTVKRQVDVSLRGVMADNDLLGVAECKHFNRKVDVKVVDSFIGFLEDVKANFGVIITNGGFTQAATNRASIKNIKLDIIKFNQLDDYQPPFHFCQICDGSSDGPPATVDLLSPSSAFHKDGSLGVMKMGHCDWCNGIHVKCAECGSVTPVLESDYDQSMECEGGCGLKFRVLSKYEGNGLWEQHLEIIGNLKG